MIYFISGGLLVTLQMKKFEFVLQLNMQKFILEFHRLHMRISFLYSKKNHWQPKWFIQCWRKKWTTMNLNIFLMKILLKKVLFKLKLMGKLIFLMKNIFYRVFKMDWGHFKLLYYSFVFGARHFSPIVFMVHFDIWNKKFVSLFQRWNFSFFDNFHHF